MEEDNGLFSVVFPMPFGSNGAALAVHRYELVGFLKDKECNTRYQIGLWSEPIEILINFCMLFAFCRFS